MIPFTPEERTAIQRFHSVLAERCASNPDDKNCPACDMRLYCYMAPPSVTVDQLNMVMDFLENRASDCELASSLDIAFHNECNHRTLQTPCEEEP